MAFTKRLDTLKVPDLPLLAPGIFSGVPVAIPQNMFLVGGSFLVNGASQPLETGFFGCPFVATRSSAGLFVIALGGSTVKTGGFNVRKVAAFIAVLGKGAAGSALRAAPGLITENNGDASLPTQLQVRLEDAAGAATDLAAATDNRVNWAALLINGGGSSK
jgi:hypothetical protein